MQRITNIKMNHIYHVLLMGFIFILLGVLLGHIGDFLEKEIVQDYIKGTGIFGPIIFCAILLITFIIAPLTGFPIVVIGIGAFGVVEAIILTYGVSMLGAMINFYIARRFGRGVVARFVGKKGMEKIDQLSEKIGVEMLVLSRLFQGFLFEWISYAAGFTSVKFTIFFIATLFGSLPYFFIVYFYASRIHDLTELFIKVAITNYVLLPIPFLYVFTKKAHRIIRSKRLVKQS